MAAKEIAVKKYVVRLSDAGLFVRSFKIEKDAASFLEEKVF